MPEPGSLRQPSLPRPRHWRWRPREPMTPQTLTSFAQIGWAFQYHSDWMICSSAFQTASKKTVPGLCRSKLCVQLASREPASALPTLAASCMTALQVTSTLSTSSQAAACQNSLRRLCLGCEDCRPVAERGPSCHGGALVLCWSTRSLFWPAVTKREVQMLRKSRFI